MTNKEIISAGIEEMIEVSSKSRDDGKLVNEELLFITSEIIPNLPTKIRDSSLLAVLEYSLDEAVGDTTLKGVTKNTLIILRFILNYKDGDQTFFDIEAYKKVENPETKMEYINAWLKTTCSRDNLEAILKVEKSPLEVLMTAHFVSRVS